MINDIKEDLLCFYFLICQIHDIFNELQNAFVLEQYIIYYYVYTRVVLMFLKDSDKIICELLN